MKPLFLIVTLFFSMLVVAQNDKPVAVPQIAVKIGLHTAVQLDAVHIEFLEVIEDSRCPKGADCIWAGEAKVKVKITAENGASQIKTMTIKPTNTRRRGTTEAEGSTEAFSILTLNPYPDVNIPKDQMEPYVLLVREN